MELSVINQDATIYSVADIFSQELVNKLDAVDWNSLPKEKHNPERFNLTIPRELDIEISKFVSNSIIPQIESVAKIKFKSTSNFCMSFWLNEPKYWSKIHTDGTIPATMQIYWSPIDSTDFGTWFYNSHDTRDILHYFPNIRNTGYLTLPKIANQPLWHGTDRPLAPNIFRLSFMIVLDDFESYR
jgi:hypothetical protein